MACTCRRVEVPGTGKGKPIKGIIYCGECIETRGRSNTAFKNLLLETLKTELGEIQELASELKFSFDQVKIN